MKRALTATEKKQTIKGIKLKEQEIADISEALEVLTKYNEYIKLKREYEDFARPINRRREDEELKLQIETKKETLRQAEYSLEQMNKHLNEGVEAKKPIGV